MTFSQFLSVISDVILLRNNVSEKSKPMLRNYPNCGELGNENNKECFWDCDWQPIPEQVVAEFNQSNVLLRLTQFVTNTECLSDCTCIKECLAIYKPIYEELEISGETNGTVFFNIVYSPYYGCLQATRQDSISIVDSTNALVFESCLVTLVKRREEGGEEGYPCIDEFLISKTKGKKKIHGSETVINSLLRTSEIRLSGYASGWQRRNVTATLHQYPWLCSLKTKVLRNSSMWHHFALCTTTAHNPGLGGTLQFHLQG